jgi:hypothetical protein
MDVGKFVIGHCGDFTAVFRAFGPLEGTEEVLLIVRARDRAFRVASFGG